MVLQAELAMQSMQQWTTAEMSGGLPVPGTGKRGPRRGGKHGTSSKTNK